MTDSALTGTRHEVKSTRLDEAHHVGSTGDSASNSSWMAMAGRDPQATTLQLDRQATELMAYVQQQNDEIDSRQAELNARLAQLDNELRTARLRSLRDDGADLLSARPAVDAQSVSGVAEPDEPGIDDSSTALNGAKAAAATASPEPGTELNNEVERIAAGLVDQQDAGEGFATSGRSIAGGAGEGRIPTRSLTSLVRRPRLCIFAGRRARAATSTPWQIHWTQALWNPKNGCSQSARSNLIVDRQCYNECKMRPRGCTVRHLKCDWSLSSYGLSCVIVRQPIISTSYWQVCTVVWTTIILP